MNKKLYQQIASGFQAMLNCKKNKNEKWYDYHKANVESLVNEYMPSGSGFDAGTRFDFDKSTPDKLVFFTDYHKMNENSYYDGWIDDIKIVVTPSLQFGYNMKITGLKRSDLDNYIDYFYDTFAYALDSEKI